MKQRYTNNKQYRIVIQTVPYKNKVLRFEQLYKNINNCWVYIKDLNRELI